MSDRHKFIPAEATRRLQKEYKAILKEPPANITAHPSPSSILEWHYVLEGSGDYEGGVYHGKIQFPSAYPYKPPAIKMFTPNGRFETNKRLCLSMSDFHPETWNPMWSVASILTGLLSFMYEDQATTGSVKTSRLEKRRLARESLEHNLRDPMFRKLFPEWEQRLAERTAKWSAEDTELDGGDGGAADEIGRREQGGGGGVPTAGADKAAAANTWASCSTQRLLVLAAAVVGVAAVMALPIISLVSGPGGGGAGSSGQPS